MYELSKHPKDQDRLRDEIRERRKGLAPGEELSELDYESMPVLNAAIKVCPEREFIVVILYANISDFEYYRRLYAFIPLCIL